MDALPPEKRVASWRRSGGCLAAIALALLFTTAAPAQQPAPAVGSPSPRATPSPAEENKPLPFTGVNLAGADFAAPAPGKRSVYDKDYTYPTADEVKYFAAKGVNIIRLPFLWERLQPELGQPFDADELGRLKSVVTQATGAGLTVLLDPHNYARYYGKVVGGPQLSYAAFAEFWTRLAGQFRDNPQVWFGLVNEPYDIPPPQWLTAANAAIAAIRQAGAKNMILVPGVFWTGAHSWISSGSGAVMGEVVDPLDHYMIEAHQYLDADSSGTKMETVSATIGSERLAAFTQWCREHHRQAFLGEFAAGNTEVGGRAIDDMLRYMEKNRDVWTGYTWWAAGPWWEDYMYTVEPKHGVDAPLLRFLTPHLQPTGTRREQIQ